MSRTCKVFVKTTLRTANPLKTFQSSWYCMLIEWVPINERGDTTASYRWTGWSSRQLQKTYRSFERNPWNIPQINKENPEDRHIMWLRASSHRRLSARAHYTSSTLIGGKSGAGPSSLRTTLEGPTENVNAKWMYIPHGFLHGVEWLMLHGHLDYFQKPSLEVGLTQNQETMALWTFKTVGLF